MDLYIASCDVDGGIFHYNLEGDKLSEKQFISLDRPMYMDINKNELYAVLRDPFNDGNSGIISFEIDDDGNLIQHGEIISTLGVVGCHLTVENSTVYVANYLSGSVFKTPNEVITHSGKGLHPTRQEAPHTHCTVFTPDRKFLCVADLGIDKIMVYDPELNFIKHIDFPSGSGPRHIAFSKNGKYLYCITELSNEIFTYSFENGDFSLLSVVSTLPSAFEGANTASAIRIDGEYLYASNRGHNSIAVYKLVDNIPQIVGFIDCGGKGPRDFNIFGDVLVCTNENSHNVTFFKLINGIPKQINIDLKIKNPLNVIGENINSCDVKNNV